MAKNGFKLLDSDMHIVETSGLVGAIHCTTPVPIRWR